MWWLFDWIEGSYVTLYVYLICATSSLWSWAVSAPPPLTKCTVMDRSLGHPHSMGQGAFLASTTANVPFFWVQHINNSALNLHRKSHKITSKGSWVIWERVYFGAQNNFLDGFPRLLCIADGINIIFKRRIQWKALDTLNICKNFDGNRARFHEDMEKTVKSALRKPPCRPKFGNCIPVTIWPSPFCIVFRTLCWLPPVILSNQPRKFHATQKDMAYVFVPCLSIYLYSIPTFRPLHPPHCIPHLAFILFCLLSEFQLTFR